MSDKLQGAGRRSRYRSITSLLLAALGLYLLSAYILLPSVWRSYTKRHPALENAPRITHTANGIAGDPLNIGLVGTEAELDIAMLAAKWFPADPITLRSSLRIAAGTVLRRSYDDAPVSNLFLFGRKQDLAFERPVGDDPRRRHHVRFWRAKKVNEQGRQLWIGAATFDTRVGLSHTTGQITHHISPEVDHERDKLINDLNQAKHLTTEYWVEGFHEKLKGKNGGGDPYHTDGRLAVGVLVIRGP